MELKICPDCLCHTTGKNFCPYCGYDIAGYTPKEHHLPPDTIIGERYIIGRVVGEGGFGITYKAADIKLGGKFAVKEYYPSSISGRSSNRADSHMIYPFTGSDEEFKSGLVRFENEARRLAKFDGKAGIVNVKDYISENGTGYIVMEYVEGISLEKYLENKGGKISSRAAADLVKPIVSSLADIHKSGLIHRDISPDNMIITEKNDMVLIDFGSARQYDSDKSMSVILKFGYAPYEQYSRHGNQGPWTDVYALCAVIYRMITGKKPPDAVARLQNNEELDFSGCEISAGMEKALRKGLEIRAVNRFQSMDEFYSAFYNGVFPKEKKQKSKKFIPVIASAAAVIVVAGTAAVIGLSHSRNNDIAADTAPKTTVTEQTVTETETVKTVIIPDINQMPLTEAEKALSDMGLIYNIEYVESLETATGNVVSQLPEAGAECVETDNVTIFVNSLEVEMVPDLSEMSPEQAAQTLTTLGFKYEIAAGEDYDFEDGQILGQSAEKNIFLKKGDTITLTVNSLPVPLVPSMPDPDKINSYQAEVIQGYPEICDIDYIMSRYKDDFEDYMAYISNGIYCSYGGSYLRSPSRSFLEEIQKKGYSVDEPEFWYYGDDFDYDGRDEYYLFVVIPTDAYYIDENGVKHTEYQNDGYDTYGAYYYIENNGNISFMFNFDYWIDVAYPTFGESLNNGCNSVYIVDYGDCKHSVCFFTIQATGLAWVSDRNRFFSNDYLRPIGFYTDINEKWLSYSLEPGNFPSEYYLCKWDGSNYTSCHYIGEEYIDFRFNKFVFADSTTIEWHTTE